MTIRQSLIFAAIALAACGGASDTKAPDRQIELAPTKVAEPQLKDQPVAKAEAPKPAPAKKEPPRPVVAPKQAPPTPVPEPVQAPAPKAAPVEAVPAPTKPPVPATGTVATGTSLTFKPASRVCTNTHHAGDRFTATLANAVPTTNGGEIPAGATAVLRLIEGSGSKDSATTLAYDVVSVRVGDQTYELAGHVTQTTGMEKVNTQSTTDKATKVGAGAVIGAIAGRILGGNTRSTVIGGAVGAAAGAAVAAKSNQLAGCIGENGAITVVLDKPLTIQLASKP